MKNKRIIVSLITVGIISLIGFTIITVNKLKNSAAKNIHQVPTYTIKLPNVFFEGQITNCKSIELSADSSKGTVDKINVKDKQKVKTGDILFSYKNEDLIQQKNDLEYQLNNLKETYNKTKKEMNSITDDNVSTIQSKPKDPVSNIEEQTDTLDLNQQKVLAIKSKSDLQGELDDNIKQQKNLNNKISNLSNKCYTFIKAPFDGVITIGDYSNMTPTKPILTLDSESLEIISNVSEKDILKLTENQTVKVSVSGTGQCINSKIKNISRSPLSEFDISQISTSQNSATHTDSQNLSAVNNYRVTIDIDDLKNVYPGFHVQISTKDSNYTIKIPKKSIFKYNGNNYIWVVKNKILTKKQLDISNWNDNYVQVKSGLNINDTIVRDAKNTMKEGDKID